MIEVEITCSLSPLGLLKLQEKLRAMIYQGVTQQRDVYYDTPTWDFLRQAVFVRIRNNDKLQIKFDEEGSDKKHVECVERAFQLKGSLPAEAHDLMARFLPQWRTATTWLSAVAMNNLVELVRLHKTRFTYTNGKMLVILG